MTRHDESRRKTTEALERLRALEDADDSGVFVQVSVGAASPLPTPEPPLPRAADPPPKRSGGARVVAIVVALTTTIAAVAEAVRRFVELLNPN